MEKEKYWNYCCNCGRNFKDIYPGNDITRLPNKDGTFICVPCSDMKERRELISKKSPAYISFDQIWTKIPGRLWIEIPFKNKNYFKVNKLYHVMIWED